MATALQLTSYTFYLPYLLRGARFFTVLLLTYAATRVAGRFLRGVRAYAERMMLKGGGPLDYEIQKRATTIDTVARKAAVVGLWSVGMVMALQEAGFAIEPILAGAGVLGLAVGFGAQSLVKDMFGGLFLLLENQIRVNDIAVINGTGGVVEEINLRTTVLRGEDGAVHIFPNGSIQKLSNMTRGYSYFVFEIPVAYHEDSDRVVAILKDTAETLIREEPYRAVILEPLDVMGVDRFADFGAVIKCRFKTRPMKQFLVGREMNRRLKRAFEDLGVTIPYPTRRVLVEHDGAFRGELKELRSGAGHR